MATTKNTILNWMFISICLFSYNFVNPEKWLSVLKHKGFKTLLYELHQHMYNTYIHTILIFLNYRHKYVINTHMWSTLQKQSIWLHVSYGFTSILYNEKIKYVKKMAYLLVHIKLLY